MLTGGEQRMHHLLVAVAARGCRNRLRSGRPGRGGGRRGQVGHGGGEGQLRQGRPEVRGGLKGQTYLSYLCTGLNHRFHTPTCFLPLSPVI